VRTDETAGELTALRQRCVSRPAVLHQVIARGGSREGQVAREIPQGLTRRASACRSSSWPAKAKVAGRTRCSAPLHRPGLLQHSLWGPGWSWGGARARYQTSNKRTVRAYGVARDTAGARQGAPRRAVQHEWFTGLAQPRSQDGRSSRRVRTPDDARDAARRCASTPARRSSSQWCAGYATSHKRIMPTSGLCRASHHPAPSSRQLLGVGSDLQ